MSPSFSNIWKGQHLIISSLQHFILVFFSGEECQKTGETFKPYRPKQKQNLSDTEMTSEADDSIQGVEEMGDNLEDLYPGTQSL